MAAVVSDHRIVVNREAFEAHDHLLAEGRAHLLKLKFRAGLAADVQVLEAQRFAALKRLAKVRQAFWQAIQGIDAILTLPVSHRRPVRRQLQPQF